MARKNEGSTVMAGECQVCFRSMVIHGQVLVLHGYERPGHGYIVGHCWGQGHEPYELSCETTKEWKISLETVTMPNLQTALQAARTPGTEGYITFSVTFTWGSYRAKGYQAFTVVEGQPLPAGWDEVQAKLSYHQQGAPDFARLRKNRVYSLEQDIKTLESDIAFLAKRIKDWKYAPERLQPRAKHVTIADEAVRAERAALKAAREQKKYDKAVKAEERRLLAQQDILSLRSMIRAYRADASLLALASRDPHFEYQERNLRTWSQGQPVGTKLEGELPTSTWGLQDLRRDLKDHLKFLQAFAK